MHTAIRATSRTLIGYLGDCLRNDPEIEALFNGALRASLHTPREMRDDHREGLSLWLYRVVRDDHRLNDRPRRVDLTHLQYPPLPVRLHYLVTPMTNPGDGGAAENEQLMLGKVLQCLHTHPVLRGADLADAFEGTDAELHVRLESLTLEEITRVWDALQEPYQLSVSYEVSLVNIDAELAPVSIAPVTIALPEYGIAELAMEAAP